MKKKIAIALFVLLGWLMHQKAYAQDFSLFQKKLFIHKTDTLPYRLLLPKDYNPKKKYPLIIFLHGAGERGNDNEKQLTHGGALFLNEDNREKYPAIIVFPQCPANNYWSNVNITKTDDGRTFNFIANGPPTTPMQLLQQLTRNVLNTYPVNKKQVYVMGLSMGGMGTFELVNRMPNVFAAAIPICGGANTATARNLKHTEWWVFHGAKDNVVPPKHSTDMVNAMKKNKVPVKLTIFPDANHNSWDPAFAEPDLLNWLFSKTKK